MGGFGAGVLLGATGGDETGRGDCVAVALFAVATGCGFATVGLTAGGDTVDCATARLRSTTTGLLLESCARPGIVVFFLGSPRKASLTAPGAVVGSAAARRPTAGRP